MHLYLLCLCSASSIHRRKPFVPLSASLIISSQLKAYVLTQLINQKLYSTKAFLSFARIHLFSVSVTTLHMKASKRPKIMLWVAGAPLLDSRITCS